MVNIGPLASSLQRKSPLPSSGTDLAIGQLRRYAQLRAQGLSYEQTRQIRAQEGNAPAAPTAIEDLLGFRLKQIGPNKRKKRVAGGGTAELTSTGDIFGSNSGIL